MNLRPEVLAVMARRVVRWPATGGGRSIRANQEDDMNIRRTVVALVLAIMAGLALVSPAVISPETLAAPPGKTMDINRINEEASRKPLPAFDDSYQHYIGVLDVLRPYPEP